MKELTEMGSSFDESLDSVLSEINNMQRNLAGLLLMQYPDRDLFTSVASGVQTSLGASAVQINVILSDMQMTIATRPIHIAAPIPCEDSLCVLTVGFDQPLSLTDVHSEYMGDHAALGGTWSSWASAPIHVGGYAAGTVCALEDTRPRRWNPLDEAVLRDAAQVIGDRVSAWRVP